MIQPVFFLAHGDPMNAMRNTQYSHDWRALLEGFHRPLALLCVSAHWQTRGTRVTGANAPATIHDFSGFPQSLYEIKYPCPGAPELADRISHRSAGDIHVDQDRGLDHGVWSLLKHIYPEADVPVVQLSLNQQYSPADFLALGQSLRYLREQGVMVIASGNIVHNIHKWRTDTTGSLAWASEFDSAVARALEENNSEALIDYTTLPHAAEAAPTPEHFLPLLVIQGLRQPADILTMTQYPHDSLENCGMRSLRLSPAA